MSPASTARGYPYPLGTDPVMQGDDAMHSLADALDVKAGSSAAGSLTITIGSAMTPVTVSVTFPTGRFKVAPVVVTTPSSTLPQTAQVSAANSPAVTATGFTAVGARTSGAQNIVTYWQAEEP